MEETEIMEVGEVADYLHLHLFTVYKLARSGQLSAFKIGNDWRFRRSAVKEWEKPQIKLSYNNIRKTRTPKK